MGRRGKNNKKNNGGGTSGRGGSMGSDGSSRGSYTPKTWTVCQLKRKGNTNEGAFGRGDSTRQAEELAQAIFKKFWPDEKPSIKSISQMTHDEMCRKLNVTENYGGSGYGGNPHGVYGRGI